jgi:acetylornithine deacetylase/succinyl-diaminopimelate desuccinylase-like protein
MSTTASSRSSDPGRGRGPIALALLALAVGCGARPATPQLVVPQPVPPDVTAELDAVWSGFLAVFGGRLDCIPDVTVLLVADVDGGDARYVPSDARVEIAIPTTPARFRESVAHELAHHVEHQCPSFSELQADLQHRFGDGAWSTGDTWEELPSERWAEHVVELVNGERIRHATEVPVSAALLDMIAAWGS